MIERWGVGAKYSVEGTTGAMCFKRIHVHTYHTVISKDLDIIHRTAQVLSNLPPDASYCVITVRLQITQAQQLCSLQISILITAYLIPTVSQHL